MHRKSAAVSKALVALVVLSLGVVNGCGSVTGSNDGGGGSGGPGSGGHGGTGAGGNGTGGSAGTGGAATGGANGTGGANATGGANGTGGAGGTGGAQATGGSPGHGGTGGTSGAGGSAGKGGAGGTSTGGTGGSAGQGGAGGIGTGGAGGAAGKGGTGGAGGASPCQAVLALDRSCTTASDCFAAVHQTNCCGQRELTGIRTSAQAQYQELEAKCDATYPACSCAESQPTTDDGSKIQFTATAGVTCLQGLCTTFVTECGKPCASGTTCFSCANHVTPFAACTTMCTGSADCHDSTLPMCQFGSSGNTTGMFCTASGVACDTK